MSSQTKYPLKVYKYRNWIEEHHKNVLLKNQLFFTSPKDFNDPFDYKIPHDYSLLDSEEKIQEYLVKKRLDSEGYYSANDLDTLLKQFEERLRNQRDKVQEDYNALYFDGVNKHYGVLSLSERWDSILMWSHYADFHKGYCIGFWEEKLRRNFIVTGGRISYPPDNSFPRLSPIGDHLTNMLQESHVKSNDWKYEEEYRLAKVFYPEIPSIQDRIQHFPDDFISEITIGLGASEKTRKELFEIGEIKKVPVYQATKKPFKFQIDRVQLS
jgi:hypothetical protein